MQKNTYKLLNESLGISTKVLDVIDEAEKQVQPIFEELDDIMAYNQYKILTAFQEHRIRDVHFRWTTGYGMMIPVVWLWKRCTLLSSKPKLLCADLQL